MVDGVYRLSLTISQVIDLGIKTGKEYEESELEALLVESQFGKTYARALEYCFARPHSAKELRDYLYRKTRDMRGKDGNIRKGVSPEITGRVFDLLVKKKYIDDDAFTRYWVENRNMRKGISKRKLMNELRAKGVEVSIIETHLQDSERSEVDELTKMIAKKRARYPDDQKLMHYLARQGFSFDDIKAALARDYFLE